MDKLIEERAPPVLEEKIQNLFKYLRSDDKRDKKEASLACQYEFRQMKRHPSGHQKYFNYSLR